MAGRLLGICRKARPKVPVETVEQSHIGLATGVAGDFRGAIRPGKSNKRQVTLLMLSDWTAALAELGHDIHWAERRINLVVDGVVLPRHRGARVRIGMDAVVEITGECDPCRRMEAVATGLEAVLTPDWRGGRNAAVIGEGQIRVGDPVEIEGGPGEFQDA